MSDEPAQEEERPYYVFGFDQDGYLEATWRSDASYIALTVDDRLEPGEDEPTSIVTLAVLGPPDRPEPLEQLRSLLPERPDWDFSPIEVREVATPRIVPPDWTAPIGARGIVVGAMARGRRRNDAVVPPVTLLLWDLPSGELDDLADALERRIRSSRVTRPTRLVTLVEQLVDRRTLRTAATEETDAAHNEPYLQHSRDDPRRLEDLLPGAAEPERDPGSDWASEATEATEAILSALEPLGVDVRGWEQEFRAGGDLSADAHGDVEDALQELVTLKALDLDSPVEAQRVGLEARLVRLLNAQASRDAAGALQRVVAALTALVLVPTLVAGVYGANVEVPLAGSRDGWRAMLAFMAAGGTVAYLVLAGVSLDPDTRRLRLALPGRLPSSGSDHGWPVRVIFVGMCGAALAVTVHSLAEIGERHASSSSFAALLLVAAVLTLAALALCAADRGRSVEHVVLDVLAALTAGLLVMALLDEQVALVIVAAITGAPLADPVLGRAARLASSKGRASGDRASRSDPGSSASSRERTLPASEPEVPPGSRRDPS